ncbi:hypothetical protein LWF15_19945 [Kineosporia rhizophila]|uniref:hypothetical protein n=1 Tax=Kineosporia rhizophila TaxID=84633 RepID=UPI000B216E6B|nr:hypothetical protein [Kineosporia rhizophila]MCE0537769.1 hypothetical protein [Kineosporia rhizophila]
MLEVLNPEQALPLLQGLANGALGEAGRQAWQALGQLIRGKRPAAEDGASTEVALPEGAELPSLVDHLNTWAAQDPSFAAALHSWWQNTAPLRVSQDSVTNTVDGTVSGHVVQARDISGGISF